MDKEVREKGAAIWRVLNLQGPKIYDERLIDANDRACAHLKDSHYKTAWDYHLEGFSPEDKNPLAQIPCFVRRSRSKSRF